MEKEKNQTIGCSVHDCEYCDCSCNKCKLEGIQVCNYQGEEGEKENTMCNSYQKKI